MPMISIPRPGAARIPAASISGPTEAAFIATFGSLLPSAQFLTTEHGNAAYYDLPPAEAVEGNIATTSPERVLFIHGVQTPALGLLPLASALRPSLPASHFVLVDLWGHGLSDTPLVPHEPGLFHDLIDALLDKLSWSTAHLVGFSFGGALTVGYAVSRPLRVSSFTLIAPAGLVPFSSLTADDKTQLNGDEETGQKWTVRFLEGGDLIVPGDWQEKVAKGEVVAAAIKKWQMDEHQGHTATIRAIVRDGGVFDVAGEPSFKAAVELGIPYYSIVGDLDEFCGENELKKVNAKHISVVQGADHGLVRSRASEVAALIVDFWGYQHLEK